MKRIDYDAPDKNTGSTQEHIAVDESMEKKYGNIDLAYEEGFAASSGVRGATADTGGRIKHPESEDGIRMGNPEDPMVKENAGLADN